MTRIVRTLSIALVTSLAAGAALAHPGHGDPGGLASGFAHPLLGWDHIAAMLAVGLWSSRLGGRSAWSLALVFPSFMAVGAGLVLAGVQVSSVEAGIALSALVLGACVAFAVRVPLWVGALLVAVFGVFHGAAHGAELPLAANPMAYVAGFVMATLLLHVAGIGFGSALRSPAGRLAVRAIGLAIAAGGAALLVGAA